MLNITSLEDESPEEKTGTNKVTIGIVSCYGGWMISFRRDYHSEGTVEVVYWIPDPGGGPYLGQVHMME